MRPLLYLLLAVLIFCQCSPAPLLQLDVIDDNNAYWLDGQEIAFLSQCGLDAHVVYSHNDNEHLYFDALFENNGETSILIDPSQISVDNLLSGHSFTVVDPEPEIVRIRRNLARDAAQRRTLFAVATVATTAAILATRGEAVSDNQLNNNIIIVDNSTNAQVLPFKSLGILSVPPNLLPPAWTLAFWKDCVARKTTLLPGQSMRGLLVVKDYPSLRKMTIGVHSCPEAPVELSFHKKMLNGPAYMPEAKVKHPKVSSRPTRKTE